MVEAADMEKVCDRGMYLGIIQTGCQEKVWDRLMYWGMLQTGCHESLIGRCPNGEATDRMP